MITIKSEPQLALMRDSGKIATKALQKSLAAVKPGITGLQLDDIAREEIYRLGGDLSYKTVPGYKWATCITINEQVVHGIPTNRVINEGDLVSIDLAVMYKGWHTDTASTVIAGESSIEKKHFLEVGRAALKAGMKEAVEGSRIGDISAAIQSCIEGAGYFIVRSLVGHGVGKFLHEEPSVPGFGRQGTGPQLKSGMTLAIEVIYAKGTSEVVLETDGWTVSSADGSLSGLFEMTVVVGKKEPKILTDWRKV